MYENTTEKILVRPNLTETDSVKVQSKNLVIEAAGDQNFVMLAVEASKPQKVKLDGVQQINSFVITALACLVYQVMKYILCSANGVQIFE